MNYCQDGLQVYFAAEYANAIIHGHYELQPNDVNGRPYFKMDIYGFWWDGIDTWHIGDDIHKGQTFGLAYYYKDVFCPHQLSELNWVFFDATNHYSAGNLLSISCKCVFIQTRLKMSNPYPHDVHIYLPNFKPNYVNTEQGGV